MVFDMTDGRRVGASLRRLRETAGMSSDELAARLGVGVDHLRAVERGVVTPSADFLAAATAVLAAHLRDAGVGGAS
ncbi:hypothetical protein GCM10009846_05070 [Agrococcus versicolor]|uniref:HTH cro/C1-type domain-containing protein n=2 Tax=Agrococcus versicolor TaxID=501482 RepID=A0ABP5MA83_9MICO